MKYLVEAQAEEASRARLLLCGIEADLSRCGANTALSACQRRAVEAMAARPRLRAGTPRAQCRQHSSLAAHVGLPVAADRGQ